VLPPVRLLPIADCRKLFIIHQHGEAGRLHYSLFIIYSWSSPASLAGEHL